MPYGYIQRFKMWLCTKLGHKYDINTLRVYDISTHKIHDTCVCCDCTRCNLTIIKGLNKSEPKS